MPLEKKKRPKFMNALELEWRQSYFPTILSEAPCLKKGDDGCRSCKETNAPDFISDDAIEFHLYQ